MKIKNDHHWYFCNSKCCYLLMLFLLFFSCDFGDTNIDPTRPLDAELKEILPTAMTQTTHNLMSIGGRVTGTVVQHFKGVDAQPESYSQYLIDERTLDEFWRTGLYGGAMKDCDIIIEKATESESPHYIGIAKILMAINLGIATSLWGDVPFENAFGGIENLTPKYDSQEEIYNSIQKLLSDGIENLEQSPSENPPLEDDLIFQGNTSKWIATAKALQARYFLHLSKRNPFAAQNALNAIQSGAFESLEMQPYFPFGNIINEAHPLPLFCFERPDQIMMNDRLWQFLENENDPRLSYLAKDVNGLAIIFEQDSSDLFWGKFDAPLPLISLSELKFIEAEATLRLGEIENAEVVLKEAVIAHFEQMNIPINEYQQFIQAKIHFENHPTFEEQFEWILEQKHVALFAQNPIDVWVDYRRTGYPQLTPPSNANSSFNPSLVVPRRYLYPISERNTNQINLENAIQNQGGYLLDVDVWAFGD